MLIKNVFYRELVANAAKILIVLIIILPITELFKLLDQAAAGHIPTITLFTLTLYATIASFPMILNIATFLAIVITFNRYSKDHELVIWLSSGISAMRWLRQTAIFITPLALTCGICSMIITPWAVKQSTQYANFLAKQAAPLALAPGLFRETPDNKQVYYIEKYSINNGYAQNIFLHYTDESNTSYNINAHEGRLTDNQGMYSITLYNGNLYQLNNFEKNNILNFSFKTFTASLKQTYDPIRDKYREDTKSYPTLQLIKLYTNPQNRSELSGRISIMIMTFVMGLIAVPLSIQTSRVQNSLVFIFPPIIYGIYQNTVTAINAWISDGKLYSAFWTMPVHIIIIGLAILLTHIKTKPNGYFKFKK